MTETISGNQSLVARSAQALNFFGLTLSEAVGHQQTDRLLLKNIAQSQVSCLTVLDQGAQKTVVIKKQKLQPQTWQKQLQRLILSAKLESVLTAPPTGQPHGSQPPLFPLRRTTDDGKALLVLTKDGQVLDCASIFDAKVATTSSASRSNYPAECWSVSDFVPNAPTFDWLDPLPLKWQKSHAFSAGALLAKLHCAGRRALRTDKLAALTKEESIALRSVLPDLKQSLTISLEPIRENFAFSHDDLQKIEQALGDAISNLTEGPLARSISKEETIVHGDFHPGNVLFQDSDALALIDLDYAHLEHPLYDIAYAVLMFAPSENFQDRADALIDGYIHYHRRQGESLPSFISPLVDLRERQADHEEPDGRPQIFQNFLTVTAYLILLWFAQEDKIVGQNRKQDIVQYLRTIIID